MKRTLSILSIATFSLASHALAAEDEHAINVLFLTRPPVINYVETVQNFVFEFDDARVVQRYNHYKIINPDALAPIMRDYPLVPDTGNYNAPHELRNKKSAAIYSELLITDDDDLLIEEGSTIVFQYPFLFRDHLLMLKLAPCKYAANTIGNPIDTQEMRTEQIDHFLNCLRSSSRFAQFAQEIEQKATAEKEKLEHMKTLWENI